MLDHTNRTKAVFTRLEKATAAVEKQHLAEGRPQNPLSTMHWTMENAPGGYKITMMRSGIVIAQKTFSLAEVADQESVERAVNAMFEGVPAAA